MHQQTALNLLHVWFIAMMMATIVRLFSMKIIAVLTLLIAMPLSAQTLRFLAEALPTDHFNDNNGIAKGA